MPKAKKAKRKLDEMSAAELGERFGLLVEQGADSSDLQNVSDALDRAQAREREAEEKVAKKARTSARVNIAASAAADNRRTKAATAAGYKVDSGTFSVLLDHAPLAYVHVVPFLSVPGHDRVEAERSRHAIGVLYNLVERHAHNRTANARAKSMGMAPTLPESRADLVERIKYDLADAIANGIVEVAG